MNKPIKQVLLATEDCINLETAVKMSGKSKQTIRYYVSKGHLTKYVTDLGRQNSPLLIHRDELLAHLGKSAKPNKAGKSNGGRKAIPTSSIAVLENQNQSRVEELALLTKEIELLKRELAVERANVENVKRTEEVQRERVKDKDAVIIDLRLQLEREREKIELLETKVERMTVYFTLPWWKKWNAGVPLLTG